MMKIYSVSTIKILKTHTEKFKTTLSPSRVFEECVLALSIQKYISENCDAKYNWDESTFSLCAN